MVEDKIEEETYSLIFTSLKHPIRRRILRMLSDKPLTYSEILEILNIDSGHLSYHLENLGDLTVHSSDGKYKLSSFGVAAVKLMGGVEEQTPTNHKEKPKLRKTIGKFYSIILALALIGASFHLITYGEIVETTSASTAYFNYPIYDSTAFNLKKDETFGITANIEYIEELKNIQITGNSQNWTFTLPNYKIA
ncbi:MAG: winged helix-turn-helix domain-containing protein [archaeon]